ncbi:hypothetical protein BDQ17DRAFT_1432924 [Cyathus striatus]|nr:hypothetical protein BDQ17DRAFT_1432924 [Cyathus striatus]
MISHQELSAQQVATYLMDFNDYYTTHLFRNLFWVAFEHFINSQLPSPECYNTISSSSVSENQNLPTEIENDFPPLHDSSDSDTDNNDDTFSDPDIDSDDTFPLNDGEDVTVNTNQDRILIKKGSQIADYVFHGYALHNMCL